MNSVKMKVAGVEFEVSDIDQAKKLMELVLCLLYTSPSPRD